MEHAAGVEQMLPVDLCLPAAYYSSHTSDDAQPIRLYKLALKLPHEGLFSEFSV